MIDRLYGTTTGIVLRQDADNSPETSFIRHREELVVYSRVQLFNGDGDFY